MAEAIDLTLSDDEEDDEVSLPQTQPPSQPQPQPQPVTSVKFEDECQRQPIIGDGVLEPAITGGKGLWSLWTRNFKSTLLMLLDLVDNSVDAAMPQGHPDFIGRVQISRDLYEVLPGQTYTTGLCIRNNSPQKITPLKEVLKLFISNKEDSGCSSIGENGVGLKQSCAALSDLSFVLVKNGKTFELGILAKALQKVEGCFLPCFEFKDDDKTTIGDQMMDLFGKSSYKEVADCIADYGKVREGGSPSLARGIARLSRRFEDIDTKFFDSYHVFEVVIDKIVYHGNCEANSTDGKNASVSKIMNELQNEIPRRYLHMPDESFQFCIGKKTLNFKYWPERMVEFSRIDIPVRSRLPWRPEDFDENTPDSYFLRLFLGFDRWRISDPESGVKKSKACSLYVYSRTSGRLIQYDQDARTMLGLVAGGTDYCQAMTIIIDDPEGHLPLDPTKQGIAFGSQLYVNVHEENLYGIVGGVSKFWYNFHKNKFSGSKAVLTKRILGFADSELPDDLKTCCNSIFTDFGLHFVLTSDNRIMVDHTCEEDEIIGPDTIFRLLSGDQASYDDESIARVSKPTRAPIKRAKKRTVSRLHDKKKKPRTKAQAAPAKKKRSRATITPSPARKKPAKDTKASSTKKKQTASSRASSRLSRRKQSSYSNRSSDPDSHSDDINDGQNGSDGELESETRNDEDLIDLCDSSDDDNDNHNNNFTHKEEDDERQTITRPPKTTLPPGEHTHSSPAPHIGPGWTQLIQRRIPSDPSSSVDRYYYSPEGTKLRSMPEVLKYLNENADANVTGDAAAHKSNENRNLNLQEVASDEVTAGDEDEGRDIDGGKEIYTVVGSLEVENTVLKSENADLKVRVSNLETAAVSLEQEVHELRAELEQSKRTLSVIRRRTNEDISESV